ncbi:unnamed protein product [Malus baccata var. baccata]
MLRVKIADKLYLRKSGSRSSESDASSIFEQAILSGTWLSRFGERDLLLLISPSSFLRMSGSSDRRFDLNFGEHATMPSQVSIWRPSFLSPTGHLIVGDSVMKNDMTAACAGSMSNMTQRLFARTCQVESLAAEVISLKQEIRRLKHENKQLHMLAHDYATNMKRKLDQLQESNGQILLDHQRFVGLFQRHLLSSSSGDVPLNEAPNDQPSVPPLSGVLPSTEAPNNHPSVPPLSGVLPTAETSPEQPL